MEFHVDPFVDQYIVPNGPGDPKTAYPLVLCKFEKEKPGVVAVHELPLFVEIE
jgi:hypothetical protein